MKRTTKVYLLIGIMLLIILSQINYGYIRSKIAGMPYGITLIDRQQLDIPEIPVHWERFPKENKLSATQIWINFDTTIPRHYAKIVMLPNLYESYKTLNFESDRYVLDTNKLSQTDLVISINYDNLKNSANYRTYEIVELNRLDTSNYVFKWFSNEKVVKKLNSNEASLIIKNIRLK
jgi:hypothetical protein